MKQAGWLVLAAVPAAAVLALGATLVVEICDALLEIDEAINGLESRCLP